MQPYSSQQLFVITTESESAESGQDEDHSTVSHTAAARKFPDLYPPGRDDGEGSQDGNDWLTTENAYNFGSSYQLNMFL